MDKFTQLVEDLNTGKLSLAHIQIAIRAHIRDRDDLQEGIKDLLCGKSETNAGMIYKMFKPIQEIVGAMWLAYDRGRDDPR